MNQPDTKTAPAAQPETRSVARYEFFTIIGAFIALGALLLTTTGRIEARLDNAIAEAAADRRAADAKMEEWRKSIDQYRQDSDAKMEEWRKSIDQYRRDSDAKMDEFRSHMRRLGERQARLEGQREADTRQ